MLLKTRLRKRLKLQEQVQQRATVVIGKLAREINRSALAGLKHGHFSLFEQDIQQPVLDMMLLAYTKMYGHQSRLNLSFEAEVRRAANAFDLDLGNVRNAFEAIARRGVQMTVNNISERVNKELGQITASLSTTRSSRLDLRLALDRMGISARNPSLIETLVRTHAQMAFSAAQQQLDADNDLIWGYRYVTVGDNRVRPDHQRLDGTVAAKDDPIWSTITPPNGWNCRCALIELLDPEPRMVPDGAAQEVDAAFQFNPGELLQ